MQPISRSELALKCVGAVAPDDDRDFRRHIDPEWIEQALLASGTATVRRSSLPADQVAWLILGTALIRNERISAVVDRVFLAAGILLSLTRDGSNQHWLTPAKSNLVWRVVEHLGRGDQIVEMDIRSLAQREHPWLPEVWRMRAIT